MSLTLIQRFYEIAKQTSEAPALYVPQNGNFQALPWWHVKSKAKHFGLGLKQEGGNRGDYFYLFPSVTPNWIFAELGALTMEIQSLVLPLKTPPSALEALFRRFPPAFIFLRPEQIPILLPLLKGQKSLRRLILDGDGLKHAPLAGLLKAPLSFREVFNSGIIHESRHHPAYREHRRALNDQSIVSPIRVGTDGVISETNLSFADLNRLAANLSRKAKQKKVRRIFAAADLSITLIRAASLFWPLGLGCATILPEPIRESLPQIHQTRSSAAYFGSFDLGDLERWSDSVLAREKHGFFDRMRMKWKTRQHLGPQFQSILSHEPFSEKLRTALEKTGRLAFIEVREADFKE